MLADYWFTVVVLPSAQGETDAKATASVTTVTETIQASAALRPGQRNFTAGATAILS